VKFNQPNNWQRGDDAPPSPAPDYRAIAERLAAALHRLRCEVTASLGIGEFAIREAVGNSNVGALIAARNGADAALALAHDAGIGRTK
jgi:hypothetical protein